MLLLIDNYDSFVHNLARYVEELGVQTEVVRNDALAVNEVLACQPRAVLLSPGPCTPNEAGICLDLVRLAPASLPILGVCLGHQVIGQAFGGTIIRSPQPMHGMASDVEHDGTELFTDCEHPFRAGRYHSLIVDRNTLPEELQVTAHLPDGTIMALRHQSRPVYGVQFHPESILTRQGHQLLANFLKLAGFDVATELPVGERPPESPSQPDFFQAPISPDAGRPL